MTNSQAIERWREIPNTGGAYEASSLGRLRSVARLNARGRNIKGKILSPAPAGRGYLQVTLYVNGKKKRKYIHCGVLEAFVGQCPEGMESRHLDGCMTNNKPTNLCWGTHIQNMRDRRAHGTDVGARKLTTTQVRKIKNRQFKQGDVAKLVKELVCDPKTIYNIRYGIHRKTG
jgi:hypothetical protein